ncbi:hypothetical protein ABT336_24210 [Micromonospora sp. NPDC000207]|uniref:hypothetical protein n=1 Tax=Micromonospora sp. NPDC000207 TaxID=3154246 RepID=UPI0033242289
MARVQVLLLPPYSGDGQPFALIVDGENRQLDSDGVADGWRRFAEQVGARGVLVTDARVDVAGDEPAVSNGFEFAESTLGSERLAAWADQRDAHRRDGGEPA